MENGQGMKYAIRIGKNVFMEEDTMKKCRNYPNAEFTNYSQCVETRKNEAIAALFPGLVPVWMAENMEEVTDNAVFSEEGRFQELINVDP
jgi:hypothetical protein